MFPSLRQVLALLGCWAVLCVITGQANHYLSPLAITLSAPGLIVAFAALRLPLGAGLATALAAGLWVDAAAPVVFGRHALLLGLAFCIVHRVRGRLPRNETVVGVVAALFVNLALFVALAFMDLGELPDPAAAGTRLLADLLVSQLFTTIAGTWFLSLQHAALRLVGAAPVQISSRFA